MTRPSLSVRQLSPELQQRVRQLPRGKRRVVQGRVQGDDPATRFRWLCKAASLPMPVTEYRFASPRRWRWDYAWPEERVALEVDGGIFTAGAHVRGARILKTHEKLNVAAGLGWRVLYCVPKALCTDATIALVRAALTLSENRG